MGDGRPWLDGDAGCRGLVRDGDGATLLAVDNGLGIGGRGDLERRRGVSAQGSRRGKAS